MSYKNLLSAILFFTNLNFYAFGQVKAPLPFGPVPNENQLRWQQMEYYAFVHFSVNTYTDKAWGNGDEDPKIFNPTKLDCRQWARVCKDAGMKGIILTAKHHSGFCLWPSKYTEYSVKNSPWRNGKGDLVREMSDACKEFGPAFFVTPNDTTGQTEREKRIAEKLKDYKLMSSMKEKYKQLRNILKASD